MVAREVGVVAPLERGSPCAPWLPLPPPLQPLLPQPQTIQPPPHQQQFQVLTTAAPTSGCGTTDYLCNDCNIVFSDVNVFLQHISHGHQEQNVVQVVNSSEPQNLTVKAEPGTATQLL